MKGRDWIRGGGTRIFSVTKTNNASDALMIEIAVTKLKDIEMESPLIYSLNSPLQKPDES